MMKKLWTIALTLNFLNIHGQVIEFTDPILENALISNDEIDLDDNNLIELSEANSFNGELWLSGLGITNLSGLEHFTSLDLLDLSDNNISVTSDVLPLAIRDLNLSGNPIEQIDLSVFTEIEYLNLDRCLLESIDISQNETLQYFWIQENNLAELRLLTNASLRFVEAGRNQLELVELPTDNNLMFLKLPENNLSELDFNEAELLIFLDLHTNEFTEFDGSFAPNLRTLSIANNSISNLDISQNPLLDVLFAGQNEIEEIDFENNIEMTTVNISNNPLGSLKVDKMVKLGHLSAENIGIHLLDLRKNTLLHTLHIPENPINNLFIEGLLNLKSLTVDLNDVNVMDLSEFPELYSLTLNAEELYYLNIANGNNNNFIKMIIEEADALDCITIDENFDLGNFTGPWIKPEHSEYSTDCAANFEPVQLIDVIAEDILCLDETGSLTVFAEGGFPPLSFNANNGNTTFGTFGDRIENLSAGEYIVYMIDAAGQISDSITIEIKDLSVAPAFTFSESSFELIEIEGDTFDFSFEGTICEGDSLDYNISHVNEILKEGTISLTDNATVWSLIEDPNGCLYSYQFIINVDPIGSENCITSHTNRTTITNIQLFPNPVSDHIQLMVPDGLLVEKAVISNAQGQVVRHLNGGQLEKSIHFDATAGYYIFKVWDSEGESWQTSFIKQQ